jgi:excisionase family DNA binding protein
MEFDRLSTTKLFGMKELAERLGGELSRGTLYALPTPRGPLRVIRIGRRILIPEDAFEEFIAAGGAPKPSTDGAGPSAA